jgi:RNA polymerase sigma-54 factor
MFQGNYTLTNTSHQTVTAHLAQTMTLLNMNTEEVLQTIETELSVNPALETEDFRRCPACGRQLGPVEVCPVCSQAAKIAGEETLVFLSPMREFSYENAGSSIIVDDDEITTEEIQAGELDLTQYVLQQLAPDCNPLEYEIAEHILCNLDDRGLLSAPLDEIGRYFHVDLALVESVKTKVQFCDPAGIASENSSEALKIQVQILQTLMDVPDFVFVIVNDYLDALLHRDFEEITADTGASYSDICDVMEFMAENLNPYPANAKWGNVRTPAKDQLQTYQHPDAIVHYINNDPKQGIMVEVVLPYVRQINVNKLFKEAMDVVPTARLEKWEQDYQKASLLVKCLQQRSVAILRLVQYLVDYQKPFIVEGEKFLKPLTRAAVAETLGVHESTISRAVSSKIMQLPSGQIIPLSKFFTRNLSVRCVLKEIIEDEEKPLSDSKLVGLLSERGYNVARRTVAKYRMMEGILPAHLRRRINHDSTLPRSV